MDSKESVKTPSCGRVDGKLEDERGTLGGSRLHLQMPAQDFGQAPGYRESQPGARTGMRIEPFERLEDALQCFRGDARPFIRDQELNRAAVGTDGEQDA